MKQLLFKLFFVPFASFFLMMFTVAIMGSLMERSAFMDLTGGTGLYIWYIWLAVSFVTVVVHHFKRKSVADE